MTNLVIGVGNILRNDDGIGALITEQIELLNWPAVETQITQQLHLEVIEDLLKYKKIIIIDASSVGASYDLQKINLESSNRESDLSSSHHLSLQLLLALAKKIYNQDINLYLCSIKGLNFEIGDSISSEVMSCIPKAIKLISAEIGVQ